MRISDWSSDVCSSDLKSLTYPRTDSRYLPEDYVHTVQQTMEALSEGGSSAAAGLRPFADTICKQKWVKPNRRIFDDKKVSDHFAIIPTLQIPRDRKSTRLHSSH